MIELPLGWVVVLDVVAWAVISAGTGLIAHLLPASWFAHEGPVLRIRRFERSGRFYERLAIKRWKDALPEAGALFAGGFSKRDLRGRDRALLERFVIETRRAEFTHWVIMLAGPLFFLWNPWWLAVVMVLYGVAANLPCLLVQRYNRARLYRALRRVGGSLGADA